VQTHAWCLRLGHRHRSVMRYTSDDVLYSVFPMFHGNVRYATVIPAILAGGRARGDRRVSASRFWDICRADGIHAFPYMGSMISVLWKQPVGPGDRDHRVRKAYGLACPASIMEPFESRFGVRLVESYGLTEAGLISCESFEDRRIGSCGRVMPDYKVAIH